MEVTERNILLTIPFHTTESATLAYDVLSVDKELKGSGIQRQIAIDGFNLVINFNGPDLKKLRVAVNGFLKNVLLIVKTMKQFHT